MKRMTQSVVLACAIILMAFILAISLTFAKIRPQLTISYLSQTNGIDHPMAFFTISNAGNVVVSAMRSGSLEVVGQDHGERVGCDPKHAELQPGESVIDTVYLPKTVDKPWRVTIYYSRLGTIRAPRIYYVTSGWVQ